MTPDQAKRAAMLLTALGDIKHLVKEAAKKTPPKYCDGRAIEISVSEMSRGVGQGSNAYIYLDLETGKELLTVVRKMIVVELAALGVKVP